MTPEGKLLQAVKRHCDKLKFTVIRLSFRAGLSSGWPDLLILIPGGAPLFMELKAPGKKPSPLQEQRLIDLWVDDYAAICCDNIDSARAAIAQALERTPVSSASCKASFERARRGAVSGPRTRKDVHCTKSLRHATRRRAGKVNAGHRAASRLPDRMAAGRAEVDGLPASDIWPTARA